MKKVIESHMRACIESASTSRPEGRHSLRSLLAVSWNVTPFKSLMPSEKISNEQRADLVRDVATQETGAVLQRLKSTCPRV